jgi:L-rhamnose mutarotase
MKLTPGAKDEFLRRWTNPWQELISAWKNLGYSNQSVWTADDYAYGYREIDESAAPSGDDIALAQRWETYLADCGEYLGRGDELRLMYHDIVVVREDKSLIRHRAFATILKLGCADEYFSRHQALVDARDGSERLGPESNFTIWCARDKYIFGYCELVKSYDHAMTPDERESTIAWETRQLEIMDWITDDVDWITGEAHSKIHRAY